MNIETLCVHSPNEDKIAHAYGAMTVPIFQTATFSHPGVGESTGYDYSRQSNPTRTELEESISALEGAYDTVATSTGMAACLLVLELFNSGDNIISQEDIY
ncbi:MAG: PLP-dependent transferase, partial [Lachnoanaerobaculum saburreum]